MQFHVILVRPPGHQHASAFKEMTELVRVGLRRLGHHVTTSENHWESDAVNIVFGAHHLLDSLGVWPADMPPRCYSVQSGATHPRGAMDCTLVSNGFFVSASRVGLQPCQCHLPGESWMVGCLVHRPGRICTHVDAH